MFAASAANLNTDWLLNRSLLFYILFNVNSNKKCDSTNFFQKHIAIQYFLKYLYRRGIFWYLIFNNFLVCCLPCETFNRFSEK